MMRPANRNLLIATACVLLYLIYACSTLISLLFDDGYTDAILPEDVDATIPDTNDNSTDVIPRIIHQTYKTTSIPVVWQKPQQSCIAHHPDYEYMFWTDESSREFIQEHYAWFLPTFDGYKHGIQRADTIRYFVLSYYGGIYIDLDDGCERSLDPLLKYPAWVRMTKPTGVSNDAMAATPGHPFLDYIIDHLEQYDRHWFMPYITVMYSTGPLFVSSMWKEYKSIIVSESDRVRILMPDEYSKGVNPFFKIVKGDSWHQEDADTIFWMRSHWLFLVAVGAALAVALGYCIVMCSCGSSRPSSRGEKRIMTRRWSLPSLWRIWYYGKPHFYDELSMA